jgi:hypothetical protein
MIDTRSVGPIMYCTCMWQYHLRRSHMSFGGIVVAEQTGSP